MFETRIKRENGLLTIHIQSEAMEAMMRSLASEKTAQVTWTDGSIEGVGVAGQFTSYTRWDVKLTKLQAAIQGLRTGNSTELLMEQGQMTNLVPLTFKGLGTGIVIKPNIPYPVDHLKAYAANLKTVAHGLLTSVTPVMITVAVRARPEE